MSFLNYVFGPNLYMEYRGVPEPQRKMYEAGAVEKFGEQILSTVSARDPMGQNLEHMVMWKIDTLRCSYRLCGPWAIILLRCSSHSYTDAATW